MPVQVVKSVSDNMTKIIPTLLGKEAVQLTYCKLTGYVLAHLIDATGRSVQIKSENMPHAFRQIKSSAHFQAFVSDIYAQAPRMSNGDPVLYLHPRLRGGGGEDKVNPPEDPDLLDKIFAITNKGLEDLKDISINEDVILLAGRTNAGKSLLGNLLCEVPIKGVLVRFDMRFKVDNPIFKVSHSITESCTGIPKTHTPPHKKYSLIDFPGFDDTRFSHQDIANLFFRKEILRNVKRMKIVLVVDWTDIDKRGTYLSNTFNDLLKFLGLTDVKDGRLRSLAQSVILVVTHTPPRENSVLREGVEEALKDYVSASYGLENNSKAVLRKIVEEGRWATFSSPSAVEIGPKVNEDRLRITALLHEQKSQYIAKSDVTIQAKVSDKHEGIIQTGLLTLLTNLKKQFAGKILEEVTDYLKKFYTGVASEKALRKFQKKYLRIVTSEQPCSLLEMLKDLQFNSNFFTTSLLEEAKKQDQRIQFLIDLLPQKHAEHYPYYRDWLGELGLRKELLKLNAILFAILTEAKLNALPMILSNSETPQTKLVLQGYFPKISQITAQLQNFKNVKEIQVHALHTVYIDEDLRNLEGVEVAIIAPKWVVRNTRTIDLTGKACNYKYENDADKGKAYGEPGKSGKTGLPGENGGAFIGIGGTFVGIENVHLKSNGGKGGPGQAGGQGYDGEDGKDGVVKTDFTQNYLHAHMPEIATRTGWDEVELPPFSHGNGTFDQRLRNKGKPGNKGGGGGQGGAGGFGGRAGQVEFISLNNPKLGLRSTLEKGGEGDNGKAGDPGLGGRHGRDFGGLWHTGGNPPHGWNEIPWNKPQFHPENRDDCPRAAPGDNSEGTYTKDRQPLHPLKSLNTLAHLYRYREFAIDSSNVITISEIESFRKNYDLHPDIMCKATVDNFIAECDQMEIFFTKLVNKGKSLPFYLWMRERIQAFKVPGDDPLQVELMQCLYTYTLSKICQLNSLMESRLIIDIKGFLQRTDRNVDSLNVHDHAVKVAFYEAEYLANLSSKIIEADVFIKKLYEDIKAADKDFDALIKNLLKEIIDLKLQGEKNKKMIETKREKLKALLAKRKALGFITIAVQVIGCCFPPVGTIVAGVVSVGLTMLSNAHAGETAIAQVLSTGIAGISEAIQAKTPAEVEQAFSKAQTQALTRIRDISLNVAVLEVADTPKSEEDQIKAMDKAIADIDEQQKQLNIFKQSVEKELATTLQELVDGSAKVQQALEGKSKIALEFNRLAVKRAFEGVKRQINESTKSFTAGKGFGTIIEQLQEAIETTANIYDHIQDYEERRTLVSYMARLAAPTSKDPRIEMYLKKVQYNLVLEQYGRALAAVRQWAFPFATIYLGDCLTLEQFARTTTIDGLTNLVKNQLKLLQDKVNGSSVEVNSAIDTYVWTGKFSEEMTGGPFYTWKCKENEREIIDLLTGRSVVLYADVNRTPADKTAIKFNHIEVQIMSTDPIVQEDLALALRGIKVEMRHSGLSFYRHEIKFIRCLMIRAFVCVISGIMQVKNLNLPMRRIGK